MGLFSSVIAPALRATYAPWDNFWFQKDPRFGTTSEAGISVSPERALRLGAVYACVRILSDMVGWLPLHVYQRRADGGKDRATDHPLAPLVRRRPNQFQTAIRWRQLGMRHILLRGDFFNLIDRSTRRIRELVPLDPDRMMVKLLPSGRRGYVYRASDTQPAMTLTQDEVFHVMGFSLDGVRGCSVIEYAREAIGRSLAEETHASRFWSQGASNKGALVSEGRMTPEARKATVESWEQAQGGVWNAHKTALLEGGLKWVPIGVTARDAQYLEGREFSVADIARWFGVPPHMIGDVDRSTSWGSGIEEQGLGFLWASLQPWLTTWEQDGDRQLLDDDDEFFLEFLSDAMIKTDIAKRASAQRSYVDGGILSINEVRLQENKNPLKGEQYEKPERAQNIGGGGDPALTTGQRRRLTGGRNGGSPAEGPAEDDARAHALVIRSAARMVRREIAAIQKWAPRYAGNPAGWRDWVCDFYGKQVLVLEDALGLDEARARQYGAVHTAALLEQGVSVLEEWDRQAPAALTALAMGEALWDAATPAS